MCLIYYTGKCAHHQNRGNYKSKENEWSEQGGSLPGPAQRLDFQLDTFTGQSHCSFELAWAKEP
jgi:hypothetical protein